MAASYTIIEAKITDSSVKPHSGRTSARVRPNPNHDMEDLGPSELSVALICPDEQRRMSVGNALANAHAGTTREYSSYPEVDEIPRLMQQDHDVVIVDLDGNPEYALDLVENICAHSATTLMVCSTLANPDLMLRCMRAGAREYLTLPLKAGALEEAMVRASVRRPTVQTKKKAGGKLLTFFGAKGGAGVTLLASNFAVMLARESGQSTLLIDLDIPFGDAALTLGVDGQYSTVDALQNASRLDANLLTNLLRQYNSSLSVLAAPGKLTKVEVPSDAIDRLIAVARSEFDNVVVDTGSRLDLVGTSVFEEATKIYLVTQVGVPELRNSNRLVTDFFAKQLPKVEIVINRFEPSLLGVDEEHITKALTKPAKWKIPNDRSTALRSQNTASPLALSDHPISRALNLMAKTACGTAEVQEKKKGILSIFG